MNALQTFDFESQVIRTVWQGENPWFVGNDVCRVLQISDARQAIEKLDDDERGGCSVPTPSGNQTMRVVSEGGLYTLILRSREATTPGSLPHRFRKWVTGEVLPTLRKTGRYDMTGRGDVSDPARIDPTLIEVERMNAQVRWVTLVKQIYGRNAAMAAYEKSSLPQVRAATTGALYEAPEDDSQGCLAHLLRVALDNGATLRGAVDAAWGDTTRRAWLSDRGIKVAAGGRREFVAVAERHPFLAQAFAGTPWADDWFLPLLGLDAARASPNALDFGAGNGGGTHKSRAVLIPKALLQSARVM